MNASLKEKQVALREQFATLRDKQARFEHIVMLGKAHVAQHKVTDIRDEANLVPGCLAKLWLARAHESGVCHFATDGDSAIMTGVSALLCDLYSAEPPEAIASVEANFVEELRIPQVLSSNRRNSLARIHEYIREFAENVQVGRSL